MDSVPARPATSSTVPPEIFQQLTEESGSRIVLVVGAGVSIEAPTGFRPGEHYSREAHRRMIDDKLLDEGDCPDPGDLSVLAETVYEKFGSQKNLTSRLPKDEWRAAAPNSGHLITGALLLEGALRHVISLNYDLAFQNAFSELRNRDKVSFIEGPDEHTRIGTHSIIQLHRSVNQDEETWVLRKTALDAEWETQWESVVAEANLSAPVVIFIGLGSPAKVLTESTARLAAKARSSYYLVDKNQSTEFAKALGKNLTGAIELYWGEFMQELAARVTREQLSRLSTACDDLLAEEPEHMPSAVDNPMSVLAGITLLRLGSTRAQWLLEPSTYMVEGDRGRRSQLAHLLLSVNRVVRGLEATKVELDDYGRFAIDSEGQAPLVLGLAHGSGVRSWSAISTKIRERNQRLAPQYQTEIVLVAGMRNARRFKVDDLVREDTSGDLIRGSDNLSPIFADETDEMSDQEIRDLMKTVYK